MWGREGKGTRTKVSRGNLIEEKVGVRQTTRCASSERVEEEGAKGTRAGRKGER